MRLFAFPNRFKRGRTGDKRPPRAGPGKSAERPELTLAGEGPVSRVWHALAMARIPGWTVPISILSLLCLSLLAANAGQQVAAQGEQPTLEAMPRTPGVKAEYKVTFVNTGPELRAVQDAIVMVLDQEILVPTGVPGDAVQIRFKHTESGASGFGRAAAVELADQSDRQAATTLQIYPRLVRDNRPQPIPAGAEVTVLITKRAGLSNPEEGGAYQWTVSTTGSSESAAAHHPDPLLRRAFAAVNRRSASDETGQGVSGLLVDWAVELSRERAFRGDRVTVTGRGYREGTTLTFWRDADLDGRHDAGEATLCQDPVDSNNTGECAFDLANPPFVPGFGDCFLDPDWAAADPTQLAAAASNCNFINAVDGQGHTAILALSEEMAEAANLESSAQALELKGRAEISDLRRPDPTVLVTLTDLPAGEVKEITVDGKPVDLAQLPSRSVPESGRVTFRIELPGGIGTGRLRFLVTTTRAGHRRHDIQAEARVDNRLALAAAPNVVLPNQQIQLSVLGFRDAEIALILVGGLPVPAGRIDSGSGRTRLDDKGRWLGTIALPVNAVTTAAGSRQLTVIDTKGRQGETLLTFPERRISVTPAQARPGAEIKVSGVGFPVQDRRRPAPGLHITYEYGAGSVTQVAATDAAGNFSAALTLPHRVGIPSRNLLRVEFSDDDGKRVVASVRHEVAAASISLHPATGSPGDTVTVLGQGFRSFFPVSSLTLHGLDLLPSPRPHTDHAGNVAFKLTVPGLAEGIHQLTVRAGGDTASANLTIADSLAPAGLAVPIETALAPLGSRFLRCFHFNNETKEWTFYDPRVKEHSTLGSLVTGVPYWILVTETTEAFLNGRLRLLTCNHGNCWNQLPW